jgi:RNA polymerase sigma-70 factor (ECF subfamily)
MGSRTADDEQLGRLMQAAQRGDADAYLRLLQEITPRLRTIIARRRGSSHAADVEDSVQEVLLSIHVARASYDPARPFLPWLMAIVRHRLADRARQYARKAAHEVQVEDLDVTFFERPTNIHSALDDRPATGSSVGALKVATHRAMNALRRRLTARSVHGH